MEELIKKTRLYQVPPLAQPRYIVQNELGEKLKNFIHSSSNLVLEIGCGVGLHPLMCSVNTPDKQFIAIERTKNKFEKFHRRYLTHDSPQNLFPIHADAEAVLNHYIPDESLSELYLLYPNPEKQNPARRWICMPLFGFVLKKLKQGAQFHMVTNELSYFQEFKEVNSKQWQLDLGFEKIISKADHPDFKPRTHFEIKYFKSGQKLYEICLIKGRDAQT
ncbi:MAG: SAM-dependent methyltransferase [Pseudobdellovibrionaceae bacterium]